VIFSDDASLVAPAFKGKTVRVTGTVTLYQDKPQIKAEDPEQIKIIDKK
jgi:DNA/RNA endonuclease YhcR with UshA esterase domain